MLPFAETAKVNIQLYSHAGGDIYWLMHPMKTFVAFHKLRENVLNGKGRQLKLGSYLAKLTPRKYLVPHQVSACWSSYYLSGLWHLLHYENSSDKIGCVSNEAKVPKQIFYRWRT